MLRDLLKKKSNQGTQDATVLTAQTSGAESIASAAAYFEQRQPLTEAGDASFFATPADGAATPYSSYASSLLQQQHMAYSIVAERICQNAWGERLFSDNPAIWNGVALRLAKGRYIACPEYDPRLGPWLTALESLNCEAAMSMTATAVAGVTTMLARGTTEVALTPVDRIQVVESIQDLATARKAQGAAFIRNEDRLIVWTNKVDDLLTVAQAIERKIVNYIWQRATGTDLSGMPMSESISSTDLGAIPSGMQTPGVRRGRGGEKLITVAAPQQRSEKEDAFASSEKVDEKAAAEPAEEDPEALVTFQERTTNLQAPLMHGAAVALNTVLVCLMLRTLVFESLLDGQWSRLAIFAVSPALFVISLFFSDSIINGICMIFGPIRQMSLNSRYYSGAAPERIVTGNLPHITIQMPVYKEPLDTVVAPTIESVNKAIATYELQGGTASIIVSEDGLLLVSEEERRKRLDFYDRHQVAWVARPGHGVDGFVRAGRFKKASNLNFTCAVSLAAEKYMQAERPTNLDNWTHRDENELYNRALDQALQDSHPLAQAAGNVRMGDLILMIDCDTQVPTDCFLDAASEMAQCPDVAILQHCSGVMLVTENNYFEKGIGFFTRCVNFAISYTVANGDVAPFMGHNAFLRWSAVQEASFVDPEDGVKKVWSESTVSEDFDMALRVLMKGYIVRWATYSNGEFKEGVSLTCDDELNRWQKYAFGVSELIFNPLYLWFRRGPVTGLWRRFLWTNAVPVHAKFGALSYVFSYYAIASALPLSMALLFIDGLFAPTNDGAFLPSFKLWVAVTVVFSALGNVAGIIARYRSRTSSFKEALVEYVSWIPFMTIFFTGLSYHVLTALFSHAFSINMVWGSTNKDLEDSNFFLEIPAMLKKYWRMLILCVVLLATIALFCIGGPLPIEWQIQGGFFVIWPTIFLLTGHIAYHLVLNPQLLRFSF